MSTTIEIDEAQTRLRDIIAQLGPHDEIVITEENRPIARLVGEHLAGQTPRTPGNCKGMITLLVEDDEHLQDFEEYMP